MSVKLHANGDVVSSDNPLPVSGFSDFKPSASAAHQVLTVIATAQSLADLGVELATDCAGVVIQAEGGDVRYTTSGTPPTSALGFLCREFDLPLPLSLTEAQVAQFYSATGSPVTLQFAQYKKLP